MLKGLTATQAAFLEAHRRIAEVGRAGVTKLDLSFLQISKVPVEIYRLSNLTELDLSHTRIRVLPAEIGNFKRLQSLDLQGTQVRVLPAEIGKLNCLQSLDLGSTQISVLPPEIGQLQRLQLLYLSHLQVSTLPLQIARLQSLSWLDLQGTQISAVPPEIGQLQRLQSLNLLGTQISALPPEIGQLQCLRSLDLQDTRISVLPPEIGQLRHLQSLDLQDTRISVLPPEIGELKSLRSLDLRATQISTLPPEIGQLLRLQSLNLSDTQITELPPELGALDDTLDLRLFEAPLPEPYPELIKRGAPAVLAYLRSLTEYEAKLMLVGEGEVGKSTLIRRLRGEDYAEGLETTHGIELGLLPLPHPELDQTIRLNSWDFGGQEIYRITHQFFFSRRSIYLLVWKPRIGREQSEIDYWLDLLKLRVGNDARVLLVATHGDERPPELDYDALTRRFGTLLAERPWVVDSKSGNGINELKAVIAREAARLPQMGERISRRWVGIRQELQLRRRDGPQITREAYDRLCRERKVPQDEADTLADLLHDLGQTVHYSQDLGLCDVVVLQPEWLTKAISYVLADPVSRDQGGVLDHARLREIWLDHGKPDRETYPVHYHRFFLRLMERFDICYRIGDRPQSLVSQLVPTARPDLPWDRSSPADGRPELAVEPRGPWPDSVVDGA